MIRGLFLCLLGVMTIQSGSVVNHTQTGDHNASNRGVERSRVRPDLAIKFHDVAQLKIASRKTMFRVGEMITLDIALLNKSSQPLFFRELSELRINATNRTGQKMVIQEYGVIDRAVIAGSFVRLSPGEMVVHSFQLLAGCDQRAFAQFASRDDDDLRVFERGLFLNWGDACLATTQPETYTISVEAENDFVLLPSRSGRLRTAVGSIKSNYLDMTISNDQ